jgi:SAM-dependent methyltransferase
LDIGCGAGTNTLWLAGKGFRSTGIDLAPGAIAAAQQRAVRTKSSAKFQEGSVAKMPFPNSSFQSAMDNGCFHSIPIPLRADYVVEVSRLIRPGGRFLLTWIGREATEKDGPPHRPSLQEIAEAFEPAFIFEQTEFGKPRSTRAWRTGGHAFAKYTARMVRRRGIQPPAR